MAEFPVFNAVGPTVDVRLFGEAAETGAKLGQQIPSLVTSAITGAQEGYKLGLQEAQTQANIDETRQKIKDQQQEEELRAVQIRNEQAIADNNRIQADVAAKTQTNKILESNQQLQTEYQNQTLKGADLTNKLKVQDALQTGGPSSYNNILQDRGLRGTFMREPQFGASVLNNILTAPDSTDEQKALARDGLGQIQKQQQFLKTLAVQGESQANAIKAFQDAQQNLPIKGGKIVANMNQFGIHEADLASNRVQTFPAGLKNVDPSTGAIIPGPDRAQDIIKPQTGYDMFVDGKKANVNLNESDNEIIQNIKRGYSIANIPTPQSTFNYDTATVAPTPVPTPAPRPFLKLFTDLVTPQEGATPKSTPETPGPNTSSPQPERAPVPTAAPTTNPGAVQIEQQALAKLTDEAQNNPDLKNRLIAKGLIQQHATPEPQSLPAPDTAQSQGSPKATATATASFKNINLPQELKKHVDSKVIKTIITNDALSGLTPDELGIVAVESGGKFSAKNDGAVGYFQLRGPAAKDVNADRFDEAGNVQGGKAYYNLLLDKYQGQKVPALMAYNIGQGVIDSAINVSGSTSYRDIVNGLDYLKHIGAYSKYLTPKNLETVKEYPKKVLAYAQAFSFVGV